MTTPNENREKLNAITTFEKVDALSLADLFKNLHIIVGPRGKCMCGVYGTHAMTCSEMLAMKSAELRSASLIANFPAEVVRMAKDADHARVGYDGPDETLPEMRARIEKEVAAELANENQAGEKQAQEWPEPLCVGATVEKGYADVTFANVAIHVGHPSNKGNCVAMVHLGGAGGIKSDRKSVERFAARIVVCVNSCRSIKDPEQAISDIRSMIDAHAAETESLRAEVARLTEACNKELASVEKLNAENQKLRAELVAAKPAIEFCAGVPTEDLELTARALNDGTKLPPIKRLEQMNADLCAELAKLRQEKEKANEVISQIKRWGEKDHRSDVRDDINELLSDWETVPFADGKAEQERDQYKAAWDWVQKHGERALEAFSVQHNFEIEPADDLRAIIARGSTKGP